MPVEKPQRRLVPVKAGGIWDESSTPAQVGGTGLTYCRNLVYRRYGSWSKRTGSAPAYRATSLLPTNSYISGYRWYRAFPTALTQVMVSTRTQLFQGGTPNLVPPFANVGPIAQYASPMSVPACFTAMRDPAESGVPGNPASDVCIIAGTTLPYMSYAYSGLRFSGIPTAGQTLYVSFTGAENDSTALYTVLASDTLGSIAVAVSNLINLCNAVTGLGAASAYVAQTTPVVNAAGTIVNIPLRASNGGANGNTITVIVYVSGTGLVVTPSTVTNFTNGGGTLNAPIKYDGQYVTGLSANINQAFTGCVSWHNHLWFWGDAVNPDTVYASDIDNPEGWSFMTQYGGYDIGVGDGDPMVQACIPIGNSLYVFKRNSIYVIQGYDFQSGDYQFSVQPVARGYGIPYRQCAAHLRNAIVFWSGTGFYRLAVGGFDPEYIGGPIPYSSQVVAAGRQDLIRCVAGSYTIQTPYGPELRTNVAIWAMDTGHGTADALFVYDDDASANIAVGTLSATYAWSFWSGIEVSTFIPFTGGAGALTASTDVGDMPAIYFIPLEQNGFFTINQLGGDPTTDVIAYDASGLNLGKNPINFLATTGWMNFDTPVLSKQLHQVFLDVEVAIGATPATFAISISSKIGTAAISLSTAATTTMEQYQDIHARVNPSLRGRAYQIAIQELAVGTGYEINGFTYDFVEEALVT